MNQEQKNLGPSFLGVLILCLGCGILLFTFFMAYQMFQEPFVKKLIPSKELPVNINELIPSGIQMFYEMIYRCLLLVVMTVVGSVLSARGVRLMQSSLEQPK